MILADVLILLLSVSTAFAYQTSFDEYSRQVCGYTSGNSIAIDIDPPSKEDFKLAVLVFHYTDTLRSNIPLLRSDRSLNQCFKGEECNEFQFIVKTDDQLHILNTVLDYKNYHAEYEVEEAGFYCVYSLATRNFKGKVTFNNTFSQLPIDDYFRTKVQDVFASLYAIIMSVTLFMKYSNRFKVFVIGITLIHLLKCFSLSLRSHFKPDWTISCVYYLVENIAVNIIKSIIAYRVLKLSMGDGIIEGLKVSNRKSRTIQIMVISYLVVKIVGGLWPYNSLIPFYDLHFDFIRRFVIIIDRFIEAMIFMSYFLEFMKLRRSQAEDINDSITYTFYLIIIAPVILAILCLVLSTIASVLINVDFYESYFNNHIIQTLCVIPELIQLIVILVLLIIWYPTSNRYESVAQDIQLDDF